MAEATSTATPVVRCKCCGHPEGEGPLGCEKCGYGVLVLEAAELVCERLRMHGFLITHEDTPGEEIEEPEDQAVALGAICDAIRSCGIGPPELTADERLQKLELEIGQLQHGTAALLAYARKATREDPPLSAPPLETVEAEFKELAAPSSDVELAKALAAADGAERVPGEAVADGG